MRVTQVEEHASSLCNRKLFYCVVQSLLPMTFGEFKTKQIERLDTDAVNLSASKTYFPSPPP